MLTCYVIEVAVQYNFFYVMFLYFWKIRGYLKKSFCNKKKKNTKKTRTYATHVGNAPRWALP